MLVLLRGVHGGSSPRARGAEENGSRDAALLRFIPACAGSRECRTGTGRRCSVHPRVRGEQVWPAYRPQLPVGSSLRARGAGNQISRQVRKLTVHPRVRGEQRLMVPSSKPICGSSPRARGAGHTKQVGLVLERFIPACAGSRITGWADLGGVTVHPRVRGEQTWTFAAASISRGSSPRARGADVVGDPDALPDRFIPACAGSSAVRSNSSRVAAVHPRVRGEQIIIAAKVAQYSGSSPRARGAGVGCEVPTTRQSVHPRVRGEQGAAELVGILDTGSSPRARGAVGTLTGYRAETRFIPACAGSRII